MLFSPKRHHNIAAILLNTQLKQVISKKSPGVAFDENLKFIFHTKELRSRAMWTLRKMSVFSRDIGCVNQKLFLMLYKACVRARLELSYALWSPVYNIKPLEQVQYLDLQKAALAMTNSCSTFQGVLTSILPLCLRLQKSILLTFCQIFAQPDDFLLRSLVSELLNGAEVKIWN